MVILMKDDKSLVISKNSRIYQKESVVDKIVYYVPSTYNGIDLSDFTAAIYYTNQGNDSYTEILTQQESSKDGYLEFKLPVTTRFTALAGPVNLMLSFVKNDEEEGKKYVLHSGALTITVERWEDIYAYVPDDSLSAIDNRILELDAKADKLKSIEEQLDKNMPNDLMLTDDKLQLSKDGNAIGSGVEILIPGDKDDEDESHDGIIDLDEIDTDGDEPSPTPSGYTFIEL